MEAEAGELYTGDDSVINSGSLGLSSVTVVFIFRVRKNAKPDAIQGLAYIFVKMLAGPLIQRSLMFLLS